MTIFVKKSLIRGAIFYTKNRFPDAETRENGSKKLQINLF